MLSPSHNTGFAAGTLVLIALFVWAAAVEHNWTVACLERTPVSTTATVTDKQAKRNKSSTTHFVYYRLAADAKAEGWQRVPRERYETTYVGQTLTVLHCTGNPARNALDLALLRAEARQATTMAEIVTAAFAVVMFLVWAEAGFPAPGARNQPREDDILWTEGRPRLFRRLFR